MPAESEKQRRFMAVQREKKRSGKKTSVNMSDRQLSDFMHKDGKMKHMKRHSNKRRKVRHESALGSKYRPSHVGM